jgi:hypothetical protein
MKHLLLVLLATLLAATVWAEPERGRLPDEQQELIRLLAAHHQEIQRTVETTESGYRSRTTSANPEVAAALIAHVRYMKRRMDSGGRVRNWDPAFREMAAYHDRMTVKVCELPDGLEVEVSGKDPSAVAVARNHARIVSGFVAEGRAAVERKHKPVIDAESP